MKSGKIRLLYVGALIESKGLIFILEAMREVIAAGYSVSLDIAGGGMPILIDKIKTDWSDVEVNFLGRISFEELAEHYRTANIGIIASVQEQASYVALEMSMFGMPIITTAVDGLDEMFENGVNSLKINTIFEEALSVDTHSMAEAIIRLIENPDLAEELGNNARKLYEDELTIDLMIKRTCEVYDSII